jgi:hypothetical protein
MSSDVRTSADTLAQAVLRHAQAVGDASPEARQQAGRALVEALQDYGVAVFNSGNELPVEFEELGLWLGEEDGIEHPEPEPDLRQRIALFTRTDLAVSDPDRLRAAAASRLADCCGDMIDDIDAAVAHPADAVSHLVGHEPTSLEPDTVDEFGLDLLSWTSTTVAGVTEDDFDEDPWSPLIQEPVED